MGRSLQTRRHIQRTYRLSHGRGGELIGAQTDFGAHRVYFDFARKAGSVPLTHPRPASGSRFPYRDLLIWLATFFLVPLYLRERDLRGHQGVATADTRLSSTCMAAAGPPCLDLSFVQREDDWDVTSKAC